MLLVAMRRLPRSSWTGGVLVLADEPSPAAQRAGRRNRAAGEGNPLRIAAGPSAAMLEATGKDERQASHSLGVVDSVVRDAAVPSCGQLCGPVRTDSAPHIVAAGSPGARKPRGTQPRPDVIWAHV